MFKPITPPGYGTSAASGTKRDNGTAIGAELSAMTAAEVRPSEAASRATAIVLWCMPNTMPRARAASKAAGNNAPELFDQRQTG